MTTSMVFGSTKRPRGFNGETYLDWSEPIEWTRDGGSGDDHNCPWWPRHLPLVIYTRRLKDRLRVRYWIRCWDCDLKMGPFETHAMANLERQLLEERLARSLYDFTVRVNVWIDANQRQIERLTRESSDE